MSFYRSKIGFTIIEVVLAAAIVGILTSVAIPFFYGFVAKARQSEVNSILSTAFKSMKMFYTENGFYTACLNQTGYRSGESRYYAIGLSLAARNAVNCGPNGAQECGIYNAVSSDECNTLYLFDDNPLTYSDIQFSANRYVGVRCSYKYPMDQQLEWLGSTVGPETFVIAAAGNITRTPPPTALPCAFSVAEAPSFDGWTIDQDKNAVNSRPGYQF